MDPLERKREHLRRVIAELNQKWSLIPLSKNERRRLNRAHRAVQIEEARSKQTIGQK